MPAGQTAEQGRGRRKRKRGEKREGGGGREGEGERGREKQIDRGGQGKKETETGKWHSPHVNQTTNPQNQNGNIIGLTDSFLADGSVILRYKLPAKY